MSTGPFSSWPRGPILPQLTCWTPVSCQSEGSDTHGRPLVQEAWLPVEAGAAFPGPHPDPVLSLAVRAQVCSLLHCGASCLEVQVNPKHKTKSPMSVMLQNLFFKDYLFSLTKASPFPVWASPSSWVRLLFGTPRGTLCVPLSYKEGNPRNPVLAKMPTGPDRKGC